MLKTLLATTAVASTMAFGALAQEAADPATDPLVSPPAADAPAEMGPETAQDETTPGAMDSTTPGAMDSETAQEPDTMAPGATPMAPQDPMVGEAPMLTPVAPDQMSAENLIGTTIQAPTGENIAEVEDVMMSADGMAEGVVAQFGGFLGFGSNTVLLSMDEIEVMQDEAGNIVVRTSLTPEALEGRPDYEPAN
jgi:hypothetical protein